MQDGEAEVKDLEVVDGIQKDVHGLEVVEGDIMAVAEGEWRWSGGRIEERWGSRRKNKRRRLMMRKKTYILGWFLVINTFILLINDINFK